jgi:hypothetical protein
MAIIANNIKVGVVQTPTNTEKKNSFKELLDSHNNKPVQKAQVEKKPTKTEAVSEEPSHYLMKTDGELIRHINKKSSYLTDMLEIKS